MARKHNRPLMFTTVMALTLGVAGCSFQAGARIGSKPEPPPPAPPAAPAPAPEPKPITKAEPAPAPAPKKSTITVKDGRLAIPGPIEFEFGKATLRPESEPTLHALKEYMEQNKNLRIRIEGHTDNIGKPEDNMKLSQDRALAIVDWLEQHGIPRDRLLAVGFGDTKPVANNATEEGRAQNRRTEFHIAEVGGKPFMGRDPTGGGQVAPGQKPPASL